MITNDYNITMDLEKPVLLQRKTFVQGDTKSCKVIITFKSNSQVVDLTGLTVNFAFQRADGVSINAMGTITDAENGVCEYVLASNILAVEGQVLMQVSLFGPENARLTSVIQVPFAVIADITDGVNPIAGSDEYPVLTQLISDCTAFLGTEATRQSNEDTRLANEIAREANEVIRQSNEDTRLANEIIRQDNESARVSAENIRQEGYAAMIDSSYIIPKPPVANYAAIATTYPTPENGWTTRCIDNGKMYRYSQVAAMWEHIDTITTTAYDSLLAQISSAQRTPEIVNNESIISCGKGKSEAGADVDYSSSCVEGLLSASVKGRTLTNIVSNGNFANGTTGWSGGNATISVANNILTVTGDGSHVYPKAMQNFNFEINKKYYLRTNVKVTNSVCTKITIGTNLLSELGTGAVKATPTINTPYDMSTVYTVSATGHTSLKLYHQYADAATANGKVMEVKDVVCVDLTANFGAGNEPDLATCDKMMNFFFDGTKSTFQSGFRLQSAGKNLFDIQNYSTSISGVTCSIQNGEITLNGTASAAIWFKFTGKPEVNNSRQSAWLTEKSIKVIKGSNYSLSHTIISGTANNDIAYALRTSNDVATISGNTNTTYGSGVLNDAVYPYAYMYIPSGTILSNYKIKFQLENGSVKTTYEPYKQNESFVALSEPLRSVPNGTKDEISVGLDGKVSEVRRNKSYVLQASDITTLDSNPTNTDAIRVNKKTDDILYGNTITSLSNAQTKLIPNYTPSDAYTLAKPYTHTNYSETQFTIHFPKGTYANLAAAQAALAGTTVIYQLATPTTTEIKGVAPISIYPKGTLCIDGYIKKLFTYATASSGIAWTTPVSGIDKITTLENDVYVEIPSTRYTLASDGKSVRIYTAADKLTEVADGKPFVIYAPTKQEESTVAELVATYSINTASTIGDVNARGIKNSKDILSLQDQVAMLIVLNS